MRQSLQRGAPRRVLWGVLSGYDKGAIRGVISRRHVSFANLPVNYLAVLQIQAAEESLWPKPQLGPNEGQAMGSTRLY